MKNSRTFTFALEPLLAQRKDIEERHRRIVGDCARELDDAHAAVEALSAQHDRHSEVLVGDRRSCDSETLRMQYAHLEGLDRQLDAAHRVLEQRRLSIEAARAELRAAAKERKALEKLKERRFQEHAAQRARAEALEFDDANARLPRPAGMQEDVARRQ